jgi:hypothetical protein
VATPAGFEPATLSLEFVCGKQSHPRSRDHRRGAEGRGVRAARWFNWSPRSTGAGAAAHAACAVWGFNKMCVRRASVPAADYAAASAAIGSKRWIGFSKKPTSTHSSRSRYWGCDNAQLGPTRPSAHNSVFCDDGENKANASCVVGCGSSSGAGSCTISSGK